MIWQNNQVKNLIWENQQVTPIPEELLNKKIFVWDINFNKLSFNKDFDRFISGQKTMHVSLDKDSTIDGRIVTTNLAWGNSDNSFDTMFMNNESITILTNKRVDLNSKLITIGNNIEDFFFAKSFDIFTEIGGDDYACRIELINVKYFIENIANDGIVGFPYNIMIGNFNEYVELPVVTWDKINKKDIVSYKTEKLLGLPKRMEVYTPEATVLGGLDLISDKEQFVNVYSSHYNGLKYYPSHDLYTLAPTQFKIFSLDNYGISAEGDLTNTVKALMFTQQLGQSIGNTNNLFDKDKNGKLTNPVAGLVSSVPGGYAALNAVKTAGTFFTTVDSIGGAFFSDRAKLATQSALTTRQLTNDGSFLKLFFEKDMDNTPGIVKGFINLDERSDTLEINRAKGSSEIGSSDLLPNGTDLTAVFDGLFKGKLNGKVPLRYNIIGKNNTIFRKDTTMPWMFAPYETEEAYQLGQWRFNQFLGMGAPRAQNFTTKIAPILTQERWDMYVRSNKFRPDAYSWWNMPLLYPSALINVYQLENDGNAVTYDSGLTGNAASNYSHWTMGFNVSKITNNEAADKRNSYMSFDLSFTDIMVDRMELMALTASEFKITVEDKDGRHKEFRFASTGYNSGTAADYINILEF